MYLPSHITLQPGDTGDFVSEMQRRLVGQKLLSEGNISGYYDGITTSAVRAFQGLNGLEADGIADPETLRLLNAAVGFFSNSDGEEATSSGWENDEEKAIEAGKKYDDFLVTQQIAEHHERLEQEAAIDYQRTQDIQIRNELRAVTVDQDKARGAGQLWGQENAMKPDVDRQAAINDMVRTTQHDIANLEKGQQNPVRDGEQLQVTREGVQAKTLGDSLKEDPAKATEQQKDGQAREAQQREAAQRDGPQRDDLQAQRQIQQQQTQQQQLGPDGKPLQQQMQPGAAQGQQQGQQQGQTQGLTADALGRDIRMQERGLQPGAAQGHMHGPHHHQISPEGHRGIHAMNGSDRGQSVQAGHHLDDRGVQNLGSVPPQQLGQLHPSSTPSVGVGGPGRGM